MSLFTEGVVCAACGVPTVKKGASYVDEQGNSTCQTPTLLHLPHVWLDPNVEVGMAEVWCDLPTPFNAEFHEWIAELQEVYAYIVGLGAIGNVEVVAGYDGDNVTMGLQAFRKFTQEEQITVARRDLAAKQRKRDADMTEIARLREQYPQEFPPLIEDDPLTAALNAPREI